MGVAFALILSLVGLTALWVWQTRRRSYWQRRGVPGPTPTPLLGNYAPYIFLQRYIGQVAQALCRPFPNAPYVGAYYGPNPVLVLQDPAIVKLVMTQAFTHFHGREITSYADLESVTRNLFFTYGDRWKLMRQNMSPVFSSTKIKHMFYLVENCANSLEKMLERESRGSDILETRGLAARYTMDAICSCGFGIEVETMGEDVENNSFKKMGDLIFSNSTYRGFLFLARAIYPKIFYALGFKAFPDTIIEFFRNILIDVFKSRNYEPSGRNDFVDIMLNLRKNELVTCDSIERPGEKVNLKIDDEFLVAQCVVFFAAGFETSSTTICLALYELAKDEESQNRAMAEVDEYLRKNDGKVHYECVNELPYLDAVLDETLRLYPVLSVLTREVMRDYTLPDGLKLERGLRIHIPVYHLQHSPENFSEPERFRPDRFLQQNRHLIKPYTYIPFGEGPRICIGMRIAKMQMLPALLTVLKSYRVELAPGMPTELEFDPRVHPTEPTIGIRLRYTKREH